MTPTPPLILPFEHEYECDVLSESTGPKIYFPGASKEGGRDGLIVSIVPQNRTPWIGVFAFGELSPKGTSGVFSTPNPHRLCVVSRGMAYLVSAHAPEKWEIVPAAPVMDVRCVKKHGIIVFANFTEIIAYGSHGVQWRTARLTWDGMKVVDVTDDVLTGEFWDIQSESTQPFTIDLKTGESCGGIEPID